METILVLAHTEDGWLARQIRPRSDARGGDALHKSLAGSRLVVGLVGENVQAAANSIAACPATKYFGVTGAEFAQSRYAHRCGGGGSHLQSGAGHGRRRSGDFALGARAARRGAAPRRTRRHPRHRRCDGGRQDRPSTAGITGSAWKARSPARNVPGSFVIDPGSQTPCECGAGTATVETVAVNLPDAGQAHHGGRHPRAKGRRANHPARRAIAIRHRRGLDEEAGRRPDACAGGGKIDPRFPQTQPRVAGQQQIAGGSKRRRPGRAAVPVASEPGRPDRRDAASCQRA